MSAILRVRLPDGTIIGIPAIKGDKGDKGDTPKKGVDYYTEDEKQELIDTTASLVLSMLPDWEGGSY